MKKITKEIKAKCFALYYGLPVIRWHQWNNEVPNGRVTMNIPMQGGNFTVDEGWYLELTPLERISDEDAIELYRMLGWKDEDSRYSPKIRFEYYGAIKFDGKENWDFNTSIIIYQYLQSKGYALPYLDYSVEDLVELGVYKLES